MKIKKEKINIQHYIGPLILVNTALLERPSAGILAPRGTSLPTLVPLSSTVTPDTRERLSMKFWGAAKTRKTLKIETENNNHITACINNQNNHIKKLIIQCTCTYQTWGQLQLRIQLHSFCKNDSITITTCTCV